MEQTGREVEEVKVVGRSGQISLGKRFAGKRLRVQYEDDGTITLTPVVIVPESALWTLQEPHLAKIKRGLAWAAEHPPSETGLQELETRAAKRRKGERGGAK